MRRALAAHAQRTALTPIPDREVASTATQGPAIVPDPSPLVDVPPTSEVLAIPTGDLSATTRKVANSIDETCEPAPEAVETSAPALHTPDETALEKECASSGAEIVPTGTRVTAEPLQPGQLSSPIERTSPLQGDACAEAASVPKLSFWARITRLVVGR